MVETCTGVETWEASFLEAAIFLPFLICTVLCLLAHTLHHYREVKTMRVLFLSSQLLVLYWCIPQKLRQVTFEVVPLSPFTDSKASLHMYVIYSAIYFCMYLLQILFRLDLSFRDSTFALRRSTFWVLFSSIVAAPTMCLSAYLAFGISPSEICKWPWHPGDIALNESMTICSIDDSKLATQGITVSIAGFLITSLNATMCCMFVAKLNKVVRISDEDAVQDRIKEIIVKNTILTTFGAASTVISYALWLSEILYIPVTFDMVLNCFVIGLMFKYNEKWYHRLCCCCIWIYSKQCRKQPEVSFLQLQQPERVNSLEITESRQLQTASPKSEL